MNDSLAPGDQLKVETSRWVPADVDQFLVTGGMAAITALRDQINVVRISHSQSDAAGDPLFAVRGRFRQTRDISAAVIMVSFEPIASGTVARFTGNPRDDVEIGPPAFPFRETVVMALGSAPLSDWRV